jgi:hypothetical protein
VKAQLGKIRLVIRQHALWLLLVLNLLLALEAVHLWVNRQGQLRNWLWHEPTAQQITLDKISLPRGAASGEADLSRFVQVLDRPLFTATRRPPPPPPPPPPPKPVDPLADFELVGLVDQGAEGSVLAKQGGKVRRFHVGDAVGEWRLAAVKGRDVIFKNGTESRTITLIRSRKP